MPTSEMTSIEDVPVTTKVKMDSDEELLASLGYRQELKRDFSLLQLLGLSFSILGVVQSITSVLVYALPYGGAVGLVWGWATCCVFVMTIAFAMAELASSAPTSGGLYYWTFKYSSPRYRMVASWVVGYVNSVGYIAGASGLEFALSVQILAAVSIGTDGTYIPTTGQTFGVFCALLLLHSLIASLATSTLAKIQPYSITLNILLFVALLIALPVATPPEFKNSASFAFGNFENLSLWPSGFAFMLSWLAPAWTMGGIDSGVHISEEVKNASVNVPRTIIVSTALGCVLGWALNIALAFNMGPDTAAILSDPVGQPMVTILLNSFGKRGALAVWSFIILTVNLSAVDLLMAASRQSFAFSRDGALPLSRLLYKINGTTGTPVNCVIFCAFGAMLLGLLSFAGPVAIGAIFSMGVVCQYISYSVPIAARFVGGNTFMPGSFYMGKLSAPVAYVALLFMAFTVLVLLFPTNPGPTSADMNYTVVVVGGIISLCLTYYFFPVYGGRHWFTGPVKTTRSVHSKSDSLDEKEMIGE
ncbi:amino acid/polyamine transporter I [Cyathus striatus]|nr:amino acid/polyamine transporter I [Cyathus striatus]